MLKNKRILYVTGAVIASGLLLTSCSGGEEATGGKRVGSATPATTQSPTPTETPGTGESTADASEAVATVNAFYEEIYGGDYTMEKLEDTMTSLEDDLTVFSEKYGLDIEKSGDPSIIETLPEEAQEEYLALLKEHLPVASYFSDNVPLEHYTSTAIVSISASSAGVFNEDSHVTFDEDAVTIDGNKATVDASKAKANASINSEYLIGSTAEGTIPLVFEDDEWFLDTAELYRSLVSSLSTTEEPKSRSTSE